jgi:ornithine cyclodeaminase/alanine dehydrogenase-like protein (mu-crystallin family)
LNTFIFGETPYELSYAQAYTCDSVLAMDKVKYDPGKEMSTAAFPDNFFHKVKLLTAKDIKGLISMEEAISLMGKAFASYSSGKSHVPQRYISDFPGLSMDIFFKPVYCDGLGRIASKILTQKQENTRPDVPTIQGVVLLFDSSTGEILSLIDGTYFTALRTGAASGIATKLLAREDAETVALFGCGAQGRTQLEAVCNVRPIKRALLYDTNPSASLKLHNYMKKELNIRIDIESDLKKLKQADIICTATHSQEPLFRIGEISRGVHINAIGSFKPQMQEIDPEVIKTCSLYVDSRKAVLRESGDLIKPIKNGTITSDFINAEIGDLVNNSVTGRRHEDEITLFKSVGIAVQDLFVANAVYNKSLSS